MRRTRIIAGLLPLLVCLAPVSDPLDAPAEAAVRPGVAHYRHLRAQVLTSTGLGSVAVGMPDAHTVEIQHLDGATGAWSRPRVLYRGRGRTTCGDIDGRTSPGGIALLVECDRPYYDDEAPTRSQALVTTDLVHWARHRLPGEAYGTPAIAPGGRYAAWQTGGTGTYVEWSTATGFLRPAATTYHSDAGGTSLVVDDAGTVDELGPEFGPSGSCRFGVHVRTLTGARSHQVVAGVEPGCTESETDGVDSLTVVGDGYSGLRAETYVVSRPDPSSPWRLTRIAPDRAPGLVDVRIAVPLHGHPGPGMGTTFQDVAGQPLVAVSSVDGQHLAEQVYDEQVQAWGPQRQVLDTGRACRDAGNFQDHAWPVFAVQLRCGASTTLMTGPTPDTLQTVVVGRRTWTISALGVLAAPDSTGTTVVTPAGSSRVPVTTGGPCDVEFGVGATTLVRIHRGPGDAWPRQRQVSVDGAAWHTVGHLRMPPVGRCRKVSVDLPLVPTKVTLQATRLRYRVLHRHDYLP